MSVKSTHELSRSQAEDMWVRYYLDRKEKKARFKVAAMTNAEIEEKLEQLGDDFTNYLIVGT